MQDTKNTNTPRHLGLILDGNRRWAKEQGLPTLEGHRKGYNNLKTITEAAFERGVEYVSAYIFSTENWNRSKAEVNYLMKLSHRMIVKDNREINKKGIKLRWLGSEREVSKKLIKEIRQSEELTKNNTKGTLALCFNYGGHREIAEALQKLVAGGVQEDDITEEIIRGNIYCPDVPDVDLVVRTSGEQRISNFMLWRAAYSELYFTDKKWPEFSIDDLDLALNEYSSRVRRLGA